MNDVAKNPLASSRNLKVLKDLIKPILRQKKAFLKSEITKKSGTLDRKFRSEIDFCHFKIGEKTKTKTKIAGYCLISTECSSKKLLRKNKKVTIIFKLFSRIFLRGIFFAV